MYAMFLILAMGLGGAVGYHPGATHHHHCMARPGTAAALDNQERAVAVVLNFMNPSGTRGRLIN
jgi:hypothetical protein